MGIHTSSSGPEPAAGSSSVQISARIGISVGFSSPAMCTVNCTSPWWAVLCVCNGGNSTIRLGDDSTLRGDSSLQDAIPRRLGDRVAVSIPMVHTLTTPVAAVLQLLVTRCAQCVVGSTCRVSNEGADRGGKTSTGSCSLGVGQDCSLPSPIPGSFAASCAVTLGLLGKRGRLLQGCACFQGLWRRYPPGRHPGHWLPFPRGRTRLHHAQSIPRLVCGVFRGHLEVAGQRGRPLQGCVCFQGNWRQYSPGRQPSQRLLFPQSRLMVLHASSTALAAYVRDFHQHGVDKPQVCALQH